MTYQLVKIGLAGNRALNIYIMHAVFSNSRPHVRDSGTVNIDVKHIYLVIVLYIGKIICSIQLELRGFFCIIQIILQDLRRVDRLLQKFRTMISAIGLTLIMLDNTFFTQSLLLLNLQDFSKEIELSKALSWRSNETSKIWCLKTIYFFEKLTKSVPPKKL